MATVSADLDQPLEDARVLTRRVAGEQGWAWAEGERRAAQRLLDGLGARAA